MRHGRAEARRRRGLPISPVDQPFDGVRRARVRRRQRERVGRSLAHLGRTIQRHNRVDVVDGRRETGVAVTGPIIIQQRQGEVHHIQGSSGHQVVGICVRHTEVGRAGRIGELLRIAAVAPINNQKECILGAGVGDIAGQRDRASLIDRRSDAQIAQDRRGVVDGDGLAVRDNAAAIVRQRQGDGILTRARPRRIVQVLMRDAVVGRAGREVKRLLIAVAPIHRQDERILDSGVGNVAGQRRDAVLIHRRRERHVGQRRGHIAHHNLLGDCVGAIFIGCGSGNGIGAILGECVVLCERVGLIDRIGRRAIAPVDGPARDGVIPRIADNARVNRVGRPLLARLRPRQAQHRRKVGNGHGGARDVRIAGVIHHAQRDGHGDRAVVAKEPELRRRHASIESDAVVVQVPLIAHDRAVAVAGKQPRNLNRRTFIHNIRPARIGHRRNAQQLPRFELFNESPHSILKLSPGLAGLLAGAAAVEQAADQVAHHVLLAQETASHSALRPVQAVNLV